MSPLARRSGIVAAVVVALASVALAVPPTNSAVSASPAPTPAETAEPGISPEVSPSRTASASGLSTPEPTQTVTGSLTEGPAPAPASIPVPSTTASSIPVPSTTASSTTAPSTSAAARRIFTGRTYVALYGKPGTRALGVLGEQGTAATIRRVKRLAASYQHHTSRTVVPALEIIATVASRGAGKDGNYSAESSVASLRPLVTAARKAGVHVVLDLQPGRSSFLTQAKRYRSLLVQPHVSLALDPEWRLKPGQVHLRQVGSVDAKEINKVIRWLADLTADHHLPQKMLLLHQFRRSMITHRSSLDMSHRQLAIAVQMDGQGSQPAKRSTYAAIRRGGPAGLVWGWKNFIDEDHPMLSPRATMRLRPQPRWVSYQ